MVSPLRCGILLLSLLTTLLTFTAYAADEEGGRPLSADEVYRKLEIFADILAIVQNEYVDEVDLDRLVHGAIDGMISSLDPHSVYLDEEGYRERREDTTGEFGGIGIEISLVNEQLTIISPIEDTPAFRAGLQAGDRIVEINGTLTSGMSVADAVRVMRGKPGAELTLTIMRDALSQSKTYTLVRETIRITSARARILEDGYGYLRISQFQDRTGKELREGLKQITKENRAPLKGLVLDLRNNPGGLLDQALAVTDLFLTDGLMLYTQGRSPESREEYHARNDGDEPGVPLVVLINGGSASASEIVAGALKDRGRALIVGTRSFGKGSVQSLMPLSGGGRGLSITTARYFTPGGISIQARGIEPDLVIPPATVTTTVTEHPRERDLANHVEPGDVAPEHTGARITPGEQDRADYQLMRALDLLKGVHTFTSRANQP